MVHAIKVALSKEFLRGKDKLYILMEARMKVNGIKATVMETVSYAFLMVLNTMVYGAREDITEKVFT